MILTESQRGHMLKTEEVYKLVFGLYQPFITTKRGDTIQCLTCCVDTDQHQFLQVLAFYCGNEIVAFGIKIYTETICRRK